MKYLFTVACLLVIFSGAGFAAKDTTEVAGRKLGISRINNNAEVARIGSISVSAEEFLLSYEAGPAFYKRQKNSRRVCLDFMIYEKLLALEAYRRGLDTLADVRQMLYEIRADLAGELLYKNEVLKGLSVSDMEVDNAIRDEMDEVSFRWLYTRDRYTSEKLHEYLRHGRSFDSLFIIQNPDTASQNERKFSTNLRKLNKNNPFVASVVRTLAPGELGRPVEGSDGWYIFSMDNRSQSVLLTWSKMTELKQNLYKDMMKDRADSASDAYVHRLMLSEEPVIVRRNLNRLSEYLWQQITSFGLDAIETSPLILPEGFSDSVLVTLKNLKFTIRDFTEWYKMRSSYMRLKTQDITRYESSLVSFIWLMTRNKLIIKKAYEDGYFGNSEIEKQMRWWKDKIVYQKLKLMEAAAIRKDSLPAEKYVNEYTGRIVRQILKLKDTYKIVVNDKVLSGLKLQDENDPRTIEMYTVKKGGTFVRQAFPTIDFEWQHWK